MKVICLFFPALISVFIRHIRRHTLWILPSYLLEYGIYVLINVWTTTSIITYIIGIEVVSTSLDSFPFFTKYTAIAVITAVLIPYIEEIIKTYISVRLTVRIKDE